MKIDIRNRLKGRLPKIGIRPAIDGRLGGVRESLEAQTVSMAKNAAKLISENLKHANGMAVECVIADTCIGGVAEAVMCADKFAAENVGVSLTVTPCWCYGSETMDMDTLIPKAIWGFNGTERPGAVYLAAALAAHSQKGLPAFSIYGRDVQDANDMTIPEDVKDKILRFAKAGIAVADMKGKSYLSIGSVSMGIAGSIVNEDFFQNFLGMRNESVDMSELAGRMEKNIYDPQEYKTALAWVKENCREGADNNPPDKQRTREQKNKEWETVIKMTLIIRDLMVGNPNLATLGFGEESLGHNAIAAGFQGQRHWSDHFPNGDFSETILNSSFDWNGIRQPYILATENDSLNAVAMLFGHLLTGTAQVFADVRTYWSPEAIKRVTGEKLTGIAENGIIHLINSGSAALDGTGEQMSNGEPVIKPFWEVTPQEVSRCAGATLWRPAMLKGLKGGGFACNFLTKGEMPVTLSRINLVKGLGPVLQLAEGYAVNIPRNVHDIIDNRSSPTWPTTWFVPRLNGKGAFRDVYSVMNNWGANHGSLSYGHIGMDMITLASMLRIPVCMHNVSEEMLFRPSAWNAFGMDTESADFRACSNLGPLYG
ncbi:MAG: L-fucose isomerase [Bacteroidetes bacterium GWF2_42_66]|nr:MAG: L-fucose isomerase [Bacteroidetes bacterium GWA2_42_15]OFX98246.1 MAG: L-fucose isomerase [Bacteroidetes bacterium GWE2_42_39]OFY42628.1 MAG: L-fucose isomerase [Bacteroidetes bacterium GWF2_42_66]HBL74229.1 L-fucose isomerase [Prolixibacteraceae bacterium]HCU63998.1 L-fucose isomerase [Prolixibacteraceae bacterium]